MAGFKKYRRLAGAMLMGAVYGVGLLSAVVSAEGFGQGHEDDLALYDLNSGLETRSISFENISGAKGAGGKAASPLGVGRKGAPARRINPGDVVEIANFKGNGTIRHIWVTTYPNQNVLRGTIIRFYWDGQETPSIEAPLGDFFGFAHGATPAYQSAVHSVGQASSMNIWLPMPFTKGFRATITNDSDTIMPFFYQIDMTVGDQHETDVGRLHVSFQRQNPTTMGQDFEILPKRTGKGRYIGAVIGVIPDDKAWWGEGEIKMYLDGDQEFATVVGTGAEDYVGLSWGLQQTPYQYHGANLVSKSNSSDTGPISMYRWHIKDPIVWQKDARITIQQIGHKPKDGQRPDTVAKYLDGLFERQDDWSAATFWYEAVPSAPLPALPPYEERVKGLGQNP